jgi:hypothetical protein
MKPGKIKIEYFQEPSEIVVTADADGLRYISEVCQRLIGKQGPAAHWHLSADMGTLEAGSIDTRICFAKNNGAA